MQSMQRLSGFSQTWLSVKRYVDPKKDSALAIYIATPAAVHPVGTFPAEQLWARIPFQRVWTIFRGGGGDSTQLSSRPVLPKPCSRCSDSQDLAKPGCQLKETSIRKKIQRWLS